MNNVFLKDIKNSLVLDNFKPNIITRSFTHKEELGYNAHIFIVPFCKTISGNNCMSIFLPKFVNLILKDTYNLSFFMFKKNLLSNIEHYFIIFDRLFLN